MRILRIALYIYLPIINIFAFALMADDKSAAIEGRWRIRERTLFLVSAIGGSAGALLGMYAFRHKTKHIQFRIGFPLIFIVHLLLLIRFL